MKKDKVNPGQIEPVVMADIPPFEFTGIWKEDGKTFHKCGNTYVRQHDENYQSKKTVYHRCAKCGKLVSRRGGVAHDHRYCSKP